MRQANCCRILAGLATMLLCMVTLTVATAFAELPSIPRADAWVTNATVNAVTVDQATGITYLGGNFTVIGPSTGSGVPVDAGTGNPISSFPKVNGAVYTAVPDGAGGWYIGGDFTTVNGVIRNRLAHILADGTLADWNPDANGTVSALALSGVTIYAGGNFTAMGGVVRNCLAAIGTDGTLAAWNPNANGTVNTLAVSGATVYAGGGFTSIGGTIRNRLASIGTDGILSAWNPNANSSVSALVVSGTTVYVGGWFTSIGGVTRNRLAAIGTNGILAAWNPDANNGVSALVVSGATVYVGGWFVTIGGTTRGGLAAINTDGTLSAWNPNANNPVNALAVNGTTVYAGGWFYAIGGGMRNFLAAIGTDGTLTAWDPNLNGVVNTLAVSGTTVYVGGTFTSMGGVYRSNLAAIDGDGNLTTWNPNANGNVTALAVSGTTVYAGGAFTSIGGVTRNRLAAISTDGTLISWDPNANNIVSALAVNGTTVYAGGGFTTMGGITRNRLAAIGTDGTLTSWDPNSNGTVSALAVSGATVYAGGQFTTMGGITRNRLAAIGTNGTVTSWDPNANNVVNALAVSGSTIYTGGYFTTISGTTRNRLSAIGIDGTLDVWDPNANSYVNTLYFDSRSNSLAAGGNFTTIGGNPRSYVAMFGPDPSTNTGLAVSPNPATVGDSVNLTATVTPAAATGTVTFKDGAVSLGTGELSGGTATYNTTSFTAGDHSLTAVYGGDSKYSSSTSSASTLTINKNTSTVAVASGLNPSTYGQSVTFTATVSPSGLSGTVDFKDNGTVITGCSGVTVTNDQASCPTPALTVGSHPITAEYSGNASYNGATGILTGGQTVNKANQTITFGDLSDKTYGDADFTVSATGGASGNPVTFASQTVGVCTTGGTGGATVHIIAAGTCTVRASQAGNDNYYDAATVDRSFTVAKATATCNVSGWSGTYDGAAHGASGTCTGIGGGTLSGLSLGSSFTVVPGGTANWSFTNANYADQNGATAITIGKATTTITTLPTATSITLGQALSAAILTGGAGSVEGSFAWTTPATVPVAGTSSQGITFTPTDTTNYNNATGTASITVLVPVTVTSSPAGRTIIVDGSSITVPQTFNWVPGDSHTIAVASTPQTVGSSRYTFSSWADGGTATRTITVPATATTYTANFTTEYQLTTAITPAGAGSVSPVSGNWYPAGAVVPVKAFPNSGYSFVSWSGPVASAAVVQTSVSMTAPAGITATVAGSPVLTAAITGKSGPDSARLWTIRLSNSGQTKAVSAQVTGLTLTQTAGTACTPTISKDQFPVAVGDIDAGGSLSKPVTITFTGCAAAARFTATIGYSANNGGAGSKSIGAQFK